MIAPNRPRRPRDLRAQMIAETEAFLTWALSGDHPVPRIPRRRVDEGGFSALLDRPMAKTIATHWWGQMIARLDRWR